MAELFFSFYSFFCKVMLAFICKGKRKNANWASCCNDRQSINGSYNIAEETWLNGRVRDDFFFFFWRKQYVKTCPREAELNIVAMDMTTCEFISLRSLLHDSNLMSSFQSLSIITTKNLVNIFTKVKSTSLQHVRQAIIRLQGEYKNQRTIHSYSNQEHHIQRYIHSLEQLHLSISNKMGLINLLIDRIRLRLWWQSIKIGMELVGNWL